VTSDSSGGRPTQLWNGHIGSVLCQTVTRLVCAARIDCAGRGSPAESFEIPHLVTPRGCWVLGVGFGDGQHSPKPETHNPQPEEGPGAMYVEFRGDLSARVALLRALM
jgi:hypothetical protein